jgi:CHASE2 domain-containing sensor protein
MKHIHKKIGRHLIRFPRHFTKYLTERDTILATVWVFVFIVGLGSIPLNLGVINPLKLSLKDFDSNDLSYSKYIGKAEHTKLDKNITIVNIGNADRELLSMLIDKVASFKPKVIALDAYFDGPKDPLQDSMLNETFKRHKNVIVASVMQFKGEEGDSVYFRGNYFNTASQYAYANIFQDSLSTIRAYDPFLVDQSDGKKYKSFSSAIVEAYNPEQYKKLEEKGQGKLLINYTRRLNQYKLVELDDLMVNDAVDASYFNGKIVLLGYVNDDPNDISDKKFTPMNRRYYGKTIPDMNGIVVHANIISMALENNYIKKLPSWANLLVAVVICWLHMSFFIRYYLESHIWFHLVAKIAQVLSVIFFVWLGIYLFDQYRVKVDMKISILVIALAVDVIYFYEAWAVWMHKKFHYHTVFKPHHH